MTDRERFVGAMDAIRAAYAVHRRDEIDEAWGIFERMPDTAVEGIQIGETMLYFDATGSYIAWEAEGPRFLSPRVREGEPVQQKAL